MESYRRASYATKNGLFSNEIEPIEVNVRGNQFFVECDEEFDKVNMNKIPQLKAAFQENGTVTAANASSISDGLFFYFNFFNFPLRMVKFTWKSNFSYLSFLNLFYSMRHVFQFSELIKKIYLVYPGLIHWFTQV